MDTRQLAALCAVVERGSFSQAAESLGVTQSAVSQAVRALEQRLGVALIDRSGRRAEPTPEGRAVMARAQRILALERDMIRVAQEEADVLRGRLAIGASTGPGARLVPRLLIGFRRLNSEVEVALAVGATQDIAQRVLAHELELGIVGAEKPHRSLVYEPFRADEIVLALPPGHPKAGGELSLEELKREPLVVQQEGSGVRAIVEAELRRLGVRPRDLNVVAELGPAGVVADGGRGGPRRDVHVARRDRARARAGPPRVGARDRAEPAPRLRRRAPGRARAVAAGHGVHRVLPRGVATRRPSRV